MFLQLIAFCSYADAASKSLLKRVASFADDAARTVAQRAAKLRFENSFAKGLSKKQKEILLEYYDEFAGVLSAERAAHEPSLQNLKKVVEANQGKPDDYIQTLAPYQDAVARVQSTLQAYKGAQGAAQQEAARAQALAQKAIEEATERTKLLSESEQGFEELSQRFKVESTGIKASEKLQQRKEETQQIFKVFKEAEPQVEARSVLRTTAQTPTPQVAAPTLQVGPTALVPTGQGLGGSAEHVVPKSARATFGSVVKTVKAGAGRAGSLVKSAATSKIAERLYAPLILLGIGTTIAVIEELDRIEQEEKEKLAALEKEQLQNQQKALSERLQKTSQQKQALSVDKQQEEQLIKEKQQKEKALLEKEISWQQLSLDVLANLKELTAEFKKTKSKETEKQFALLSTKLRIMQLLDQALAQMQKKPVAHKEIQQELDAYKNQIEELKSAFYKEMREKESSITFGAVQNRFVEAKVFATPIFKKYGATSSKNMEVFLNKIVGEYREMYDFANSIAQVTR